MSLKTRLTDLTAAIAAKTNRLHELAELKENKKTDLSSTSDDHYPSVPAVKAALDLKVDKDGTKVLSDENYTTAEKTKLAELEGTKYRGQYLSLVALQTANPTPSDGEYADVDAATPGEDVIRYIYDSNDDRWVAQQGESSMMTNAQIKSAYESNPDTNAFTDANVTELSNAYAHISATNNPHGVTKNQVGLGNVDNTSDVNKPVSTAQATAIAVVQDDLDDFKLDVGENFSDATSDYATQYNNATPNIVL